MQKLQRLKIPSPVTSHDCQMTMRGRLSNMREASCTRYLLDFIYQVSVGNLLAVECGMPSGRRAQDTIRQALNILQQGSMKHYILDESKTLYTRQVWNIIFQIISTSQHFCRNLKEEKYSNDTITGHTVPAIVSPLLQLLVDHTPTMLPRLNTIIGPQSFSLYCLLKFSLQHLHHSTN